jgi:eukaryotic-like serine/threonine-protein kinase
MLQTSAVDSLRQSLSLSVLQQPAAAPSRSLASQLAGEMADRWQQGERPPAEEFLARHPELRNQPDAALRLVCEEICLRQEFNEELDAEQMLARFPHCRDQIAVLLDCHRLLVPETAAPAFPAVGEWLGDFELVAELGRGGQGCVFLAKQPSLADRPVVVKVTPRTGNEHLSLARLQHTYIVPLYFAEDDARKNLRILCMRYFGGTSLAHVIDALAKQKPLAQRTGLDLLSEIDKAQARLPIPMPKTSPTRQLLARFPYAQAVAFLGACLADALHYAHERGLVHLDIKPGNVLLAADGQPMLLDFHLAHRPLRTNDPEIDWFGGTPDYMSPEQADACKAIPQGEPVTKDVDARSDIYSLGLTLYESLAGARLPEDGNPQALHRLNPQVSVGLSDIIGRCLRPEAKDRYPDAANLAADLRRHLTNQPLRGVKNRSWAERWWKWRQRKPHALTLVVLVSLVLAVLTAGGTMLFVHHGQRVEEGRTALRDGTAMNQARQYPEAARVLNVGLQVARNLPNQEALVRSLDQQLSIARYGQLADNLHRLAEQVRFLYDADNLSRGRMQSLESACRAVYDARATLLEGRKLLGDGSNEDVRTDFLDLVILWTALRVRLAEPADPARREALDILAEAEAMFGPNAALLAERQRHAEALGLADVVRTSREQGSSHPPRTAWDHYTVGRSLLRAGKLEDAAAHFDRSVELQPQGFWPNYYQGVCAYRRGEPGEAAEAFRVCIALAPDKAACYYNRGLAYQALNQLDRAANDYDRALSLDPALGLALFNRAILYHRAKQYPEAIAGLQQAMANGIEPALVHYNLALVYQAKKERTSALDHLQQAIRQRPGYKEAEELREAIRREK